MLSVILAIAFLRAAGEPAPAPASAKGVVAAPTGIPGEPPYGLVLGRHIPQSDNVCFRDPVVGSKIPTRRCMSRQTFVQRQQDSKDHTESIQRDSRIQAGL